MAEDIAGSASHGADSRGHFVVNTLDIEFHSNPDRNSKGHTSVPSRLGCPRQGRPGV